MGCMGVGVLAGTGIALLLHLPLAGVYTCQLIAAVYFCYLAIRYL